MHQTFYIDIDEEITSIVDRLRKAKAKEIIIVVPQRALLIQSIVNLKLLKKEANNLGKEIAIITQDKLGKMLVEKTGIIVQQKLDDMEGEELMPEDISNKASLDFDKEEFESEHNLSVRNRLETMGSAEYFEEASGDEKIKVSIKNSARQKRKKEEFNIETAYNIDEEKIINKELVIDIGEDMGKRLKRKKAPTFDIMKKTQLNSLNESRSFNEENETMQFEPAESIKEEKIPVRRKEKIKNTRSRDEIEDEKVRNFFQHENFSKEKKKPKNREYDGVNLSGKFWKYFAGIGLGGLLLVALAAAYLFFPKADIKIFVKANIKSTDAQIKGASNLIAVDFENRTMPVKTIASEAEFSDNFTATGDKSSTSQKARGMITIYNEYSSSSQPLIATTRFQSPDGKIFRLIKSVVVPGTNNVSGETKPGAIEAEVIADESGEAYNIDATTFTIPGFKDGGTEKHTKIYAKSFKKMSGGGNSEATVKSISTSDIANAKTKALAELNKNIKQRLKDSAGEGNVVLDDAIVAGEPVYEFSNLEGEIVENFKLTAKIKAGAIIFSEKDLKEILEKDIAKMGGDKGSVDKNSLSLQFGKSDVDLAKGEILIRVNASVKINPNINPDDLKKGILGKSEDDFKAYLKDYPDVKSVEIDYQPSFISGKIPAYASRVKIELDNN